jgi:hypothetical protein
VAVPPFGTSHFVNHGARCVTHLWIAFPKFVGELIKAGPSADSKEAARSRGVSDSVVRPDDSAKTINYRHTDGLSLASGMPSYSSGLSADSGLRFLRHIIVSMAMVNPTAVQSNPTSLADAHSMSVVDLAKGNSLTTLNVPSGSSSMSAMI